MSAAQWADFLRLIRALPNLGKTPAPHPGIVVAKEGRASGAIERDRLQRERHNRT